MGEKAFIITFKKFFPKAALGTAASLTFVIYSQAFWMYSSIYPISRHKFIDLSQHLVVWTDRRPFRLVRFMVLPIQCSSIVVADNLAWSVRSKNKLTNIKKPFDLVALSIWQNIL